MRGEVLGFDQSSGTGVLRAEDGRRYGFALAQWRESETPVKGDRIDFEPSGQQAVEIYLVTGSGIGGGVRSFPSRVRAFGGWFRRHPEAVVALLLMASTALPVYGFLGVDEPLLAAPRVVERLELGLGRIRMLVADIPEADTAAAALRAVLPMIYMLWAVPILALLLLYRSLAELPRRALAFWTGISAVLLPVLLPLLIAVPTTFLVLSRMPADMRSTVAGSVFDAASLGPFQDIAIGGLAIMMLGFALVVWGMKPETARRPQPKRGRAAKPAAAKPRRAAPRNPKAPPPPAPQEASSPPAPRTPVPPPPPPPQQSLPAVAGPAHPPRPAQPQPRRITPAPVREFAPPVRDPAMPASPPPSEIDDPLPLVLTRGRQPSAGVNPPDNIDARAGAGMTAEASVRGWEVEATSSMDAEPLKPSMPAPELRGTHDDDEAPYIPPPSARPNGALPQPEPPAPPPEPAPAPPPPRFELDQGPDAVMKLYEKLRAERLARDGGKKDGK